MKKIIFLYCISIIAIFFLPAILVKQYNIVEKKESTTNKKIKLLTTENNKVIEIDLEEYIMGVLVGEMPVNYNIEALKAQAIVARTYTLNKIMNSDNVHKNADMCDDINHCQAYKTKEYALKCWDNKDENQKWDKIKKAVLETSGIVITYEDTLINAFFHANSGGRTEDISNIWGRENIPYLKSVDSNEENNYIDKKTFSYDDFNKKMKEKYTNYIPIEFINESIENKSNDMNFQTSKILSEKIKVIEINSSGRVSKFQISNILLDGTEVRNIFGLRSTLFNVNFKDGNIIFDTRGYGHGIGMSQNGANDMANNGSSYEEIIKHYYTGVDLKYLN